MDRRRLTGLIALIALVAVVTALVYLDAQRLRQEPQTAFAPAQSTDESVPVPDDTAPPPAPAVAANPPAPAPDVGATDNQVALADPKAQPPAPATTVMPGTPVVPTFDVVRVEPTGETVIAGQAEPSSKVEVLDGSTVIATAEANERGEWAMALDKPLAPGAHDLAVRTTTADKKIATLSDQRVTVSVPEKGSKDVLVVLNAPDAASKVLEVPKAEGEQIATNAPAAAPAETPASTPDASTTVAAAPTPADTTSPATTEAPALDKQTPAIVAGEPPAETEPKIVAEAPVPTEPAIKAEPPVEPEPLVVANNPPAAEAPAPPAAPPEPTPEVTVTAVEAEMTGSLYIAGTAATPEPVRVYIDDKVVGDAAPSPSGTWLVQAQRDMPAGKYTVRADQIDAGGNVVARSEVPFEREVQVATLKQTVTAGAAADSGATVTGKMPEMETVIIKRGDNLWRIARGAWGKGMRWSTIYQANTDQIRDPHWIYPGQVFVMPKGNATWTN